MLGNFYKVKSGQVRLAALNKSLVISVTRECQSTQITGNSVQN